MNWLAILLQLAPTIVAGVQKIAGDNAAGQTKKQMAMDALNIATAGALQVDPNDAAITQAASNVTGLVIDAAVNNNKQQVTSQVIDHTVTQLKAAGVLPTKPTTTNSKPRPLN